MNAAVIACGALAAELSAIRRRRGWEVDIQPLSALMHNRPEEIAQALRAQLERVLGAAVHPSARS